MTGAVSMDISSGPTTLWRGAFKRLSDGGKTQPGNAACRRPAEARLEVGLGGPQPLLALAVWSGPVEACRRADKKLGAIKTAHSTGFAPMARSKASMAASVSGRFMGRRHAAG